MVKATRQQQLSEGYDEEFRVVRPDGSIRWVHERAFPIYDKNGAVYRIAGIAEDTTSRRRLEKQVLEVSDQEQRRIGQDLTCKPASSSATYAYCPTTAISRTKPGRATCPIR